MAFNSEKEKQRRADMAFYVAIIGGLVLGLLIKRVRVGLLLGLAVAGLIVFAGWAKTRRRS